jgi:hypothetical protein
LGIRDDVDVRGKELEAAKSWYQDISRVWGIVGNANLMDERKYVEQTIHFLSMIRIVLWGDDDLAPASGWRPNSWARLSVDTSVLLVSKPLATEHIGIKLKKRENSLYSTVV